jgi:hypothetical protein
VPVHRFAQARGGIGPDDRRVLELEPLLTVDTGSGVRAHAVVSTHLTA